MNFDTLRPLRDILTDYRRILEQVYDPVAFAGRLEALCLPCSTVPRRRASHRRATSSQRRGELAETVHRIINASARQRAKFLADLHDMRHEQSRVALRVSWS